MPSLLFSSELAALSGTLSEVEMARPVIKKLDFNFSDRFPKYSQTLEGFGTFDGNEYFHDEDFSSFDSSIDTGFGSEYNVKMEKSRYIPSKNQTVGSTIKKDQKPIKTYKGLSF